MIADILVYYDIILKFINSVKVIYIILILIGAYFWYIQYKYRTRYRFEKPLKLEFLQDLIIKSIGGVSSSINLFIIFLKTLKLLIISIIVLTILFYIILGIKGIYLIFYLIIIFLLNNLTNYLKIQVEEGHKNNNYISTFIVLNSIKKLVITFIEYIISKKLIYSIAFLTITIILISINTETFKIWAFVWIIWCSLRLIKYYYLSDQMRKLPLFVNVEYLSGDIENHLILYDSTSMDYRFKGKGIDELIIPATSVKKITPNYDFILNQLDYLLNLESIDFDNSIIHKYTISSIINAISDRIMLEIIKRKPHWWYKKAIIYCTMKDDDNARQCLSNAIEFDNKYRDIAKNDINFDTVQNKKWFISLTEKTNDI